MVVRFKTPTPSLEATATALTLDQVIKIIQRKHTVTVGRGASEVQILQAEKALKLDFPEPYRSFLAEYGTISFGSTEILGIASGHLDTTKATLEERRYNRNFPSDVFIVERLGIDGVLAVMTPDGMVRMVKQGVALEKPTAQPFLEYLTDAVSDDNSESNVGWRSALGTVTANDISAYERAHSIKLPEQYKKLVLAHNGARPMKDSVMVGKRECVVERLISWDKNAKANIHFWQKSLKDHGIFPFATDPFGNAFCFDYSKGSNPVVVFWDHEEDNITVVAENFDKFIASLK